MDSITKSLREYLTSENISHTTMYNKDCGNKIGQPTSTCFIITREENTELPISIIIDIFPEDNQFFLSAHPHLVFEEEDTEQLQALEKKWNRSGFMTTLIIEEENGVINPNMYCFKLMTSAFCGDNGPDEFLWKRYLKKIVEEYSYIEQHFNENSIDLPCH